MKLSTIQKRNNLNVVWTVDSEGPGGAFHRYAICKEVGEQNHIIQEIIFQKCPRNDPLATEGVLDTDLLEIVRDRLKAFQAGPYSCRENACALTRIEEALMWMNKRVEDRAERGVLGTTEK